MLGLSADNRRDVFGFAWAPASFPAIVFCNLLQRHELYFLVTGTPVGICKLSGAAWRLAHWQEGDLYCLLGPLINLPVPGLCKSNSCLSLWWLKQFFVSKNA